jgi:hypothetical protein
MPAAARELPTPGEGVPYAVVAVLYKVSTLFAGLKE